jgi:rubrerythrin
MLNEQEKTIDALRTAVQMEIDGRKFYLKASSTTKNEIGKKLLARLADEEEIHQKVFREIYDSVQNKKGWPKVDFRPDNSMLQNLFSKMIESRGQAVSNTESELDIIRQAKQIEANTYDFYTGRSKKASAAVEKELYELVAAQEQVHNLVLTDYMEYLQNPAGWFVKKEHPHFD